MPILVTKVYLCDTDSMDEAYDWTKPTHEKVETYQVGQLRPFNPNALPDRPPSPQPGPRLAPVQNQPTKPAEKQ